MIENETLLDVVMRDGKLFKRVIRNGESVLEEIVEENKKEETSFSERFSGTETIPQDWTPPSDTTQILTPLSHAVTKSEHIDRSLRVEAILVKAFSPRMKSMKGEINVIDTKGNGALKELLTDLCKALGGDWEDRISDIK